MIKARKPAFGKMPLDLRACGVAIVFALFCAGLPPAHAQQPMPAPQDQPVVAPPATPDQGPGLFDALGRLLSDSKAKIDEHLKNTQGVIEGLGKEATDAARSAAGAAQEATGVIVGLPMARIVDGRELCLPAPNGAPNCPPAVNALCRRNGFATGRSLEISTSEKCPPRVLRSGRPPQPGECANETFVLRAACQ